MDDKEPGPVGQKGMSAPVQPGAQGAVQRRPWELGVAVNWQCTLVAKNANSFLGFLRKSTASR